MALDSNAKQNIPQAFLWIMENDTKQDELRAQPVVPFAPMAELIEDRRNLRKAAEEILHWNKDKGNRAK